MYLVVNLSLNIIYDELTIKKKQYIAEDFSIQILKYSISTLLYHCIGDISIVI